MKEPVKMSHKASNGITLIALVITVIVLVILVGTVISLSLNQESLFKKTNSSVEKWNIKVAEEDNSINYYLNYYDRLFREVTITATQEDNMVKFTIDWTGMSEEEKLNTLLPYLQAENINSTEELREMINKYAEERGDSYENALNEMLIYYDLDSLQNSTEGAKLSALLDAINVYTINDVKNEITRVALDCGYTYDHLLCMWTMEMHFNDDLNREISIVGPNEETILTYNYDFYDGDFYITESGIYKITATIDGQKKRRNINRSSTRG
ncbi:MAG: hypothetical protein IKP28_03855 [Clostridia bacterium]|nr:hypothetical protein [Clostridia bacterium]